MTTTCKHYNECGCEFSDCCFDCPLPVCKFEEKQGAKTVRDNLQHLRIAHLRDEGRTVKWIGQVMGVSVRSVFRSLSARNCATAPLTDTIRRATMDIEAHSIVTVGDDHAR